MKESLEAFLCINQKSKRSITQDEEHLSWCFSGLHFYSISIKNAFFSLRCNMNIVQSFVDFLRDLKAIDSAEFFKTNTTHDTSVLTSVAWRFVGSRALVDRVGDICFPDLTGNLARYKYKLTCFIVADSEGKSRTVLFRLPLFETVIDFQKMFSCGTKRLFLHFQNLL